MRVLLQPVGSSDANKHFVDTIESPVALDRINASINDSERLRLSEVFAGRAAIPTWGVTPGKNDVNVRKWDRIQPGDLALFSRDGHIMASSFVAAKIHARELALELWQTNADGEAWEYVYFLDEVTSLDIPYAAFNRVAGYKETNVIQGFNVLDESRSVRISEALELRSQRYHPEASVADYQNALRDRLLTNGKTDIEGVATQRLEQNALREALFGQRGLQKCSICDVEYSADFLVASHLKKRAICSTEERLDFLNVAAPMCKAGCDALYEQGYIMVDGDGVIREGRQGTVSPGVNQLIKNVINRDCKSWSVKSEAYFKWHRENTGVSVATPTNERRAFVAKVESVIRAAKNTMLTSLIEERPARTGSLLNGRVLAVSDQYIAVASGARSFTVLERRNLSQDVSVGECVKARVGIGEICIESNSQAKSNVRDR